MGISGCRSEPNSTLQPHLSGHPFLTLPYVADVSTHGTRRRVPAAPLEIERQRLRSLERSGLLDTGDEERFDRLTRRAQVLFGVTTAFISLIAGDRQYLKSVVGPFPRGIRREEAFCTITIQDEEPLLVPDLRADQHFQKSPLVVGAPFIRFYAGVPLRGPGGWFIGSMCILDTEPRDLSSTDRTRLRRLADEAELEFNAPV